MSEQSKSAEKCFAEHMHIHESGWTNCACDRDAGHDDDYHEDSSVQVRWPVKAPVKGYVVRGKDAFYKTERSAFNADGWTARPEGAFMFSLLPAAMAAQARMMSSCTDVTIFAVGPDGTETPLPSYEEVVDKLSILREMAKAALDWQRPGGMRPTHPPELAGCPAGALREILRIVGQS